jgi:HK97 gp10 family phage protein
VASQLEGVAELTKTLNAMGVDVAAPELRGTARSAMKIAFDKMLALIPVGKVPHATYKGNRVFPGFSRRSLRLFSRINKRNGTAEAIVGPSREAFYATQFVELGTSKMAARPWMRPAFESSVDPILREIANQLRKRLSRRQKRS